MIYWELCKQLRFDSTNQRYMQKAELFSKIKCPRKNEIQVGRLILTRMSDLVVMKKNFANCFREPQSETKEKQKNW